MNNPAKINLNRKRKTVKKTRKIAWAALGLIVIVLIFGSFFGNPNNASAAEILTQKTMNKVIVQDGDTLWSLIKANQPNYTGNMEKAIWEVKKINGLKNSTIYAGDILWMPILG